jgi:hypothetical protein
MRFLLVACLLILGWYGLYVLAKELSTAALAVTTLNEIAALTKRPLAKAIRSTPTEVSGSMAQRFVPLGPGKVAASLPQQQEASPKPAMTRVSDIGPFLVEVLFPARLHRGPSVDTPIIGIEWVGTTLLVSRARQGWFEVSELTTGNSGWIYGKYLGAVGGPTKVQIASENLTVGKLLPTDLASAHNRAPAKLVADAKQRRRSVRYKAVAEASARASEAKVDRRPHHDEMASLLERGFSGY